MLSRKFIPIKSTCFNASGYFDGRAAFRYRSGRVIYREIPVVLWQQFMEAESKGRFFNQNIKFIRKGDGPGGRDCERSVPWIGKLRGTERVGPMPPSESRSSIPCGGAGAEPEIFNRGNHHHAQA